MKSFKENDIVYLAVENSHNNRICFSYMIVKAKVVNQNKEDRLYVSYLCEVITSSGKCDKQFLVAKQGNMFDTIDQCFKFVKKESEAIVKGINLYLDGISYQVNNPNMLGENHGSQ